MESHRNVRKSRECAIRYRTEPSFIEDEFAVSSRPELVALPPVSDADDFGPPCERFEIDDRHGIGMSRSPLFARVRAIPAAIASCVLVLFGHVGALFVAGSRIARTITHRAAEFRRIRRSPLESRSSVIYHTDIETQYQYGLDDSQLPGGGSLRQIASHSGQTRFGEHRAARTEVREPSRRFTGDGP